MEPDTTWLSSPFLNTQRATWRGTMETESSNTRQGVERRKSNVGWTLTSKHARKGQGCHSPCHRSQSSVRLSPLISWESDPQWEATNIRGQNWDTLLRAALSSTLFLQGMKAKQQRSFNRLSLGMDQLWHLASSSLAPENQQSLQMPCGLSSASFLVQ